MQNIKILMICYLNLFLAFSTCTYAEVSKNNRVNEKNSAEDIAVKQATTKLAGLDFGIGISLTVDTGDDDRVSDAEIVAGKVRVSKKNNASARIMLESHYFFTPELSIPFLGIENSKEEKPFGFGPFISLQPGTDEVIEAIALGLMFGFKRTCSNKGSWNIGIGRVVDTNVRTLGDGFEENRLPPKGEDQIRFKETEQWGTIVLCSFSF